MLRLNKIDYDFLVLVFNSFSLFGFNFSSSDDLANLSTLQTIFAKKWYFRKTALMSMLHTFVSL